MRVVWTTQFKKDYKRAKKQGRPLKELRTVINKLARGEKLAARYKDHSLKGPFKKEHRECHIRPDWLLIYRVEDDALASYEAAAIQIYSSNSLRVGLASDYRSALVLVSVCSKEDRPVWLCCDFALALFERFLLQTTGPVGAVLNLLCRIGQGPPR